MRHAPAEFGGTVSAKKKRRPEKKRIERGFVRCRGAEPGVAGWSRDPFPRPPFISSTSIPASERGGDSLRPCSIPRIYDARLVVDVPY